MSTTSHHPQEQNYYSEIVEVEYSDGTRVRQETFLLRIYPTTFNGYDAYMDIQKTPEAPTFCKVHCQRLGKSWEIVNDPQESVINGQFRGDETTNNPPAWIFGLKLL